jgi:hypothetical protein
VEQVEANDQKFFRALETEVKAVNRSAAMLKPRPYCMRRVHGIPVRIWSYRKAKLHG